MMTIYRGIGRVGEGGGGCILAPSRRRREEGHQSPAEERAGSRESGVETDAFRRPSWAPQFQPRWGPTRSRRCPHGPQESHPTPQGRGRHGGASLHDSCLLPYLTPGLQPSSPPHSCPTIFGETQPRWKRGLFFLSWQQRCQSRSELCPGLETDWRLMASLPSGEGVSGRGGEGRQQPFFSFPERSV